MFNLPFDLTNWRKTMLLTSALILLFGFCYAQDDVVTIPEKKSCNHENFIGVQLNELIRQVVANDPTTAAKQNPYLLTYAENSLITNWGIRAGLGIQAGRTVRTGQNFGSFSIDTATKVAGVQVRCGVTWTRRIFRKLIGGMGCDMIAGYSETEMKLVESGVSSSETINTKIVTYGVGPVATLRYEFSNRIALGTETSFYFVGGEVVRRVSNGSSFGFPEDDLKSSVNSRNFNLPVAVYFIIKL